MQKQLLIQALTKYLAGLVIMGMLLFLPAGTWNYPNAWIFLGLLFIPMLILGMILYVKAPDLLRKRMNHKEQEKTQKGVVAISGVLFLMAFIAAGLDFRYEWSQVSEHIVVIAGVVLLLSYFMYGEVMRENTYLSRTVEIQENQKLITTGLYGIVRHPMYTATIFLFLSFPLVLGSWVAFGIMLLYPILIILRIHNEEQLLENGLDGYKEYKYKVKYRLFPFIW